jgi:hypothetical protein
MDPDLALVLGLLIAFLSVPAMVSAYSDSRPPRAPALVLLIAGGLILYALTTQPGGYRVADIPEVFFGVVARFWP